MQILSKTLLFALALAACPALSESTPAPASGPDLSKTWALFQSWTRRKSFPDSITLAYYHADARRILGETIDPETRDKLVSFIQRCQQEDGGFATNPDYGVESSIVFTYYGLAALRLLGADDAVDRGKALDFVRGLIDAEGGVRAGADETVPPTLASTFFGVESLRLLQGLDALDKEETTAFVLSHRAGNQGGFAATTKGAARPRATSMAVRTLMTLGTLDDETKAQAVGYLESAIALIGTKGPQFRAFSSMQAVSDIVAALDGLSATKDVIPDRIVAFVNDRYVPENGGFGPMPGLGTTPPSTYQALFCLDKLGALPQQPGT